MHSLENIRARTAAINTRLAAITSFVENESRSLTTDEIFEADQLAAELSSLQRTEDVLVNQESLRVAASAQPVQQRAISASAVRDYRAQGAPAVLTRTTQAQRNGDKFPGQSWARINMSRIRSALSLQAGNSETVQGILAKEYPERPELGRVAAYQQRNQYRAAGVVGGGTVSPAPGFELLQLDAEFTGDFITFLYSRTLFDKIGFRQMPADVRVKGQDGAFAGYFVGQKRGIPASVGSYSSVDLSVLKAAGLTYLSRELIERSAPAAEILFRDGVVEAISQAVDTLAFSATAVSAGIAPAGLLNGLSGVASVGGRLQDLYADLYYLTNIFVAAKQSTSDLTLVSTPTIANQIAHLLRDDTGLPAFEGKVTMAGGVLNGLRYVTGDNVVAGNLLLIKPSDVWVIGDSGVRVDLSTDATIEADSAPAGEGVTPTTASANMVSMFQNDMVAIRAVRDINWQYRRAQAIVTARKTAVKYDGTQSTTD